MFHCCNTLCESEVNSLAPWWKSHVTSTSRINKIQKHWCWITVYGPLKIGLSNHRYMTKHSTGCKDHICSLCCANNFNTQKCVTVNTHHHYLSWLFEQCSLLGTNCINTINLVYLVYQRKIILDGMSQYIITNMACEFYNTRSRLNYCSNILQPKVWRMSKILDLILSEKCYDKNEIRVFGHLPKVLRLDINSSSFAHTSTQL